MKYAISLISLLVLAGCTQETQNNLGRAVQNWTGSNGILEVYAGEKLVKRFMQIDKVTTAAGTNSGQARPYRFGYGILDSNLNGVVDDGEKKVYFEFSDYSTSYIFYGNQAKSLWVSRAGTAQSIMRNEGQFIAAISMIY